MQWIYWIAAIIVSAGAGYWVYRADRKRSVPQPLLTAALRSLLFLLVFALLLVPQLTVTKTETLKPQILILQDDSRSVSAALKADTARYRKDLQQLQQQLGKEYTVVNWGFGANTRPDSLFTYRQSETDIAMALNAATEYLGARTPGAVILATDGRFNKGAHPLYQHLSLHNTFYTVALGDSARSKDLRIAGVYANKTVTLNSRFEIRADVLADLCDGYEQNLLLKTANHENIGSQPVRINGNRFSRSFSFTVKADKPGLQHYVLTLPAAGGEVNTANNQKSIFVEVVNDKKNILLVAAAPHPDIQAIREAIAATDNFRLTVRMIDNLPGNIQEYQAIILHGLPTGNGLPAPLAQAHKPCWYIVTPQVSLPLLNQSQTAARLEGGGMQDITVSFNSRFNGFNVPANIQAILDKLPPLSGPMGDLKAAPNTEHILVRKTGNIPVWMLQDRQPAIALLDGEGLWRWRLYEYKNTGQHSVVDELIRQTLTFLTTDKQDKPFRIVLPKYLWSDQEPVTLKGYLYNTNQELTNTPDATLVITDSNGRKKNYQLERDGNSYRLNLGIWAGGTYNYNGQVTYNGKTYTEAGSFVVENTPVELMETGADYPFLSALAHKYDGSQVPYTRIGTLYDSIRSNPAIKPVLLSKTETLPLIDKKWYFFLILFVAVAEWLLRKYWMAE